MKFLKFVFLVSTLFLASCQSSSADKSLYYNITIGGQTFETELADTPEKRIQGLMSRSSLDKNKGMLFSFEKEGFHAIWMKNTLLPLDIIWISKDQRVVDVQSLSPCTEDPCPSFRPRSPAKFILEVNKGSFLGQIGNYVLLEK